MAFNVGDYVRTKNDFWVSELRGGEGRIALRTSNSYGVIFFNPSAHLHNGIFERDHFSDLPQWTYSFRRKQCSFWVDESELVKDDIKNKIEGIG